MQLQDLIMLLLRIQAFHASASSVQEWRRQQTDSFGKEFFRTSGHSGNAAKGVASHDSGMAFASNGEKGSALKRSKGDHEGMMFGAEHQQQSISASRVAQNVELNRLLRGYESEDFLRIRTERRAASKMGMSMSRSTTESASALSSPVASSEGALM